jgi:outer membrane protein OmpA-like peptidoglycan-associated protein
MANRTGKCTNYTKCTTAYRNQPISVPGNFICPECGQPLQEVSAASPVKAKLPLLVGAGVAALVVIGLIVFFATHSPKETKPAGSSVASSEPATAPGVNTPEIPPATAPVSTPEPATPPAVASTSPAPGTTSPTSSPNEPPLPTTPEPPAEPAQPVVVEQTVNVDPANAVNQETKTEVLKRIDAMPKLSDAEKDKLYASVERARGMGRIITIPFASGQTTLSSQNINELKAATQTPQVAKMVSDPTVVFVILGYADTKGQPAANEKVSNARAESAMQALRDKCGFLNVMHAVGMGGSELFASGDRAKNRVVEVWAVLP